MRVLPVECTLSLRVPAQHPILMHSRMALTVNSVQPCVLTAPTVQRGHIKSLNNGETWTLREPRGQRLARLDARSSQAVKKLEQGSGQGRNATKVVQGQVSRH